MSRESGAGEPPTRSAQVLYLKPAGRATHNLPPSTIRVVGRDAVIDLLHAEVHQARVVSIVGAGGIGKTTVALAVADLVVGTFRDGVWIVDFAPLRDASLVAYAIASATGLVVHSADVLAALCRYVRERELLLVLDNCEHLVSPIAACLAQVVKDAPGVHVLATSRAPLRMQGESVHTLPGLALPAQSYELTARQALASPAVELFVERATDRLDTFALTDENAPVVASICRSLDGIALAIELAAMRIDAFGVKGLEKQLDDRFRLLTGRRAGMERHRTLAAALDWSYNLLSAQEAVLLQAVSVFSGAFDPEGASSVANIPVPQAAAILTELASQSLLSIETRSSGAAYRPLETTRAYCQRKLLESGQEQLIRQRHAGHVCAVLERAAAQWGQQPSREWAAQYGAFLDDLRAALAWATDPAHVSLHIRLTAAGILLWNHFSLTDESRVHLARAIEKLAGSATEGTAVEMNLQFALAGAILYTRGVVPEARTAMRRALHISGQLNETDFRLRCLRLIGTYELFCGEADAGLQTLGTFLSIASAQDPTVLAEGETHYSVGELFTGQLLSARSRMERLQAQEIHDFNDTRFARFQYSNSVNILVVLCHAQCLTGLPETAARTAVRILEYGRAAAHELSLSIALAFNSLAYLWLGREDDCTCHAAMLDELVEQHGIVTWRPIVTFCRGAVAARRNPDSVDAINLLTRSIDQFCATGHRARLPYYIGERAHALARQARIEEAESAINEALALAVIQNEQWCVPELLRIQAFIASAQDQQDIAERLLQQSIAQSARIGALAWQLRSANDLALLWQARSRGLEARQMLSAVLGAFTEGAASRDLLAASRLLDQMH